MTALVSRKRTLAATLVALSLFALANVAVGLTSANAPPGTLALPAPHVGDKVLYEATVTGWPAPENGFLFVEVGNDTTAWDRDGTERGVNALHVLGDAWGEDGWNGFLSTVLVQPDGRIVASAGGWAFAGALAGGGLMDPGFDFSASQSVLEYPGDEMQDCLFRNPFQGRSVGLDAPLRLDGWCGVPGLPGAVTPGTPLHALATQPLADGGSAVRLVADDGKTRLSLWLRAGSPYPIRIVQEQVEGSATLQLVAQETGTVPVARQSDVLQQSGPIEIGPRLLWGPEDDAVDHPFPLSTAYKGAHADMAFSALREYREAHPDAMAYRAEYEESWSRDRVERKWHIAVTDGVEPFGFVALQTTPLHRTSPLHGVAPVAYVQHFEAGAPLADQAAPPSAWVTLPTVQSVLQRWQDMTSADPAQAGAAAPVATGWGFAILCDDPCDGVEVYVWAGSARTDYGALDPANPAGLLAVKNDRMGNLLVVDAFGMPVRLEAEHFGFSMGSLLGTSPTGSASAPQLASNVAWVVPSHYQLVSVGALALAVALLVALWPSIKALPAFGLFSRVHGPAVANHPARAAILQAVGAEPGIHFTELRRRTGGSNGATIHHVRKLVHAGLVLEKPQKGYTCYFPKGTDRHAAAAAPVLRAPSARRILATIDARPGLSARDIAEAAGLAPPTVSYHLARLREAGLISAEGRGTLRLAATPLGHAMAAS
jgi:predicted transcriptional regulator